MFQKKKDNLNISENLANKIPYLGCYEEEGVIEVVQGKFTKMYLIEEIKPENIISFDSVNYQQKIEILINDFSEDISCQFCSHNKLIKQEDYLTKILVTPNKEEKLNTAIAHYNNVLVDNVTIGHNNVHKTTYFVIAVHAPVIDDAIDTFRKIDGEIRKKFSDIYNIKISGLTLMARLKIMFTMFNPTMGDFAKKLDLSGDGNISIKDLKYMHLTTKDLVAPKNINSLYKNLNYLILNEGTEYEYYVRTFFINSIPKSVSSNFISDLTNISSNMIYSCIFEPLDTQLGFDTVSDLVAKNTTIIKKNNRNTVADRKNKTQITIEEQKKHSELDYFNKAALSGLKYSVANNHKTMNCTFTIALYAEDLEALDRDTDLLRISATKFACNIKPLDLQQLQGFQTILPLCHSRINTNRIIDVERLALMIPLNVQDVIKKNGLYNGINSINDNLILLNRKNNVNFNGLITGVEHSGKTYQNKREIFNALISTKDICNVITFTDEYDEFAEMLGGKVITSTDINMFKTVSGYGLLEDDYFFKSYFYDAVFTSLHNLNKNYHPEEVEEKITLIEAEVRNLVSLFKDGTLDSANKEIVLNYIKLHENNYPFIAKALTQLPTNAVEDTEEVPRDNRLLIYKVTSRSELLLMLDYLWNIVIEDKRKNMTNWIFIDSIDCLLKETSSSDYFIQYLKNCNDFETILTSVIQDSVKLVNQTSTLLLLEEVVASMGYVKLLNLGPIERRKYVDLLNIPNALIPYITNVEPGKGLILTNTSNITFDDSFLADDDPFKKIFAKEIKQIILDQKFF